MARIIGIDLGTTNSSAAYWSRRRPKSIYNTRFQSPLTPSVVALDNLQRYVGQDAKDRRMSGSKNVIYSIKRFIGRNYDDPEVQKALRLVGYTVRKAKNGEVEVKLGDRYYFSVEISAMILGQLKADAESELGEPVSHAVITVPAYFGQRQKNATREAGILAGLKVLRIINEPTAAALSFGIDETSTEPQYLLVYDFGGGTFDLSILLVTEGNFEVLQVGGDTFLGGDDFDNLIVEELLHVIKKETAEDFGRDEVIKSILKGHAEQAKINLSREEQTRIIAAGLGMTSRNTPINLDFVLTRSKFEDMISPMIDQSIEITYQMLKKANLDVADINRVLLVGGSTRVPLIRRRLKEIFDEKIEIDVDPMLCVALGAAIQTAIPIEWVCKNCNTVNEGGKETCNSCGQKHEAEEGDLPIITCEACGKNNPQGIALCWNCGALIGAVIDVQSDISEKDAGVIRIGDITSKNIGIEVENHGSKDGKRSVIIFIPKGTPYPTYEPCQHELYTNRTDQNFIEIPIYEFEEENAQADLWEHIGTIYNEKTPAGTPANTPVIVEARIDADGILTISSYLKRMKDETYIQKSFEFAGVRIVQEDSEILNDLGFVGWYLNIVGESEDLNKYLQPGQADQCLRLSKEANEVVAAKDEIKANKLKTEIDEFIKTIPVPTWDVFRAYWIMAQPQISVMERQQMSQIINQMNTSASQNNFPLANQYLNQLRKLNDELSERIPSNFLRAVRS